MGGNFFFRAYPQSLSQTKHIESLFQSASNEVARIELLLTDFKPSPFNEINKYAGIKPVKVCDEIFDLIQKAISISKITKGSFDISTASTGHLWREAKKNNVFPDMTQLEKRKVFIDYRLINCNLKDKTIFLPHKEMRISLGGIGKGYAVDQAFNYLRSYALSNFYINGSGDIRVHSDQSAPRPWRIGLRNPFSEDEQKSMGVIQLRNQAICSSGDYINVIKKDHQIFHHIVDPKLGKSNNHLKAVTVLADTTVDADVLATTLMTMNEIEASTIVDSLNLNALWINQKGKVSISNSLKTGLGLQ